MTLTLEVRAEIDRTPTLSNGSVTVSLTPRIDEDYWAYRVAVTPSQAVVGFPKFGTIGIGFAVEEDWNTNLPHTSDTEDIREHIWHNRGDDSITREIVDQAISLIQERAHFDRDGGVR